MIEVETYDTERQSDHQKPVRNILAKNRREDSTIDDAVSEMNAATNFQKDFDRPNNSGCQLGIREIHESRSGEAVTCFDCPHNANASVDHGARPHRCSVNLRATLSVLGKFRVVRRRQRRAGYPKRVIRKCTTSASISRYHVSDRTPISPTRRKYHLILHQS
jgi:hypothetical protein